MSGIVFLDIQSSSALAIIGNNDNIKDTLVIFILSLIYNIFNYTFFILKNKFFLLGLCGQSDGLVAEWLCRGLQILLCRFDSDPSLQIQKRCMPLLFLQKSSKISNLMSDTKTNMIESLTLTNFRNHTTARITTAGHRNIIITGPNGTGKTAIIEAVSMLSGDRGMRAAPMTDIARFNGDGGFSVFAELSDETIVCVYFNSGDTNRRAKLDGDNATLTDLSRRLRIVWLTPREDRIFIDSASERRTFFDRLAASFDSAHSGRIARHTKLMTERASALKIGADDDWLNALDEQIASTAVAIAAARIQYAGEINFFMESAAVSVDGLIESMIMQQNAAAAEREYLSYLKSNRYLTNDKMILDGINKSDFGVFNQKLNLPANLTSTGQQKTTLIELILAHAKLIYTKTGAQPIILLDEAAAHLDTNARKNLFEKLGAANAQVWATGLEPDVFHDVPDATFVACVDGKINNILV